MRNSPAARERRSPCGPFFCALCFSKEIFAYPELILFSNSTGTSTRVFFILAFAHSTRRSAATPRSIPVSQNEKFASYLVPFSFENSIIKRKAAKVSKGRRISLGRDACAPPYSACVIDGFSGMGELARSGRFCFCSGWRELIGESKPERFFLREHKRFSCSPGQNSLQ